MSTTAPAVPGYLSGDTFLLAKLSVVQFQRMISVGILGEDEPIELLQGYMVDKVSRGAGRDAALCALDALLPPLAPAGWLVRGRRPFVLADSQLKPDLAVVRGPAAGLVIEVSDASLDFDRLKGRVYARAATPVYWIVNVVDKVVEVYTQPSGPADAPAYADRQDYPVGTAVPVVLDGATVGTVPVAEVMG
jgi:hypothetical protein